MRENLEKCYPNILRVVSRQIHNEGNALLYHGKTIEAEIDEDGLLLCDQEYCCALHEMPRDLAIVMPDIEALTVHLYFESGRERYRGYRELSFFICSLANALTARGLLKQLTVLVSVFYDWEPKLTQTSREDERVLERLLIPFDLLRNLDTAEITVQGKSFDPHYFNRTCIV